MVRFFTYVYYRALNYYELDYQAATPLQVFPAMNIATCIVMIIRLLGWMDLLYPPKPLALVGLVVFIVFFFFFLFSVLIYIKVKKKSIDEKIQGFSRETAAEKRNNGRKVLWYYILSPLLFVLALVF
jgi:hypothetical protein